MKKKKKQKLKSFNFIFGMDVFDNIKKGKFKYLEKLNRELEDKLKRQAQEIRETINYVKRIQVEIFPSEAYINKLFPGNFVLNKPCEIIGGDFYWLRQIDDYIIVVASDYVGHGIHGALRSIPGIFFLNDIVIRRKITNANQILEEVRKLVIHSLWSSDKNPGEGHMAICVINKKSKILQFSGAYIPVFIIRNGELSQFKADRMPLGIHHYKKSFTNHEFQLQTGDKLYLSTDGYTDQFGGLHDKKFNYKQFNDLLINISQKTMNEQKQILNDTIEDWKKGRKQTDDILIIGIRVE